MLHTLLLHPALHCMTALLLPLSALCLSSLLFLIYSPLKTAIDTTIKTTAMHATWQLCTLPAPHSTPMAAAAIKLIPCTPQLHTTSPAAPHINPSCSRPCSTASAPHARHLATAIGVPACPVVGVVAGASPAAADSCRTRSTACVASCCSPVVPPLPARPSLPATTMGTPHPDAAADGPRAA